MYIRYIYLILIVFVTLGNTLSSQEQVRYAQYMYNKYEFNPAFAGLDGSLNAYSQIRNQWSNLELNPTSYLFNVDFPLYRLGGAIGLKLSRDESGYLKDNRMSMSYNYIYTNSWGLLSSGVGLGYRQLNIDGAMLRTPEGEYGGGVNHNDPILGEGLFKGRGMLWDMGLMFVNRKIEAGISISNTGINKFSTDFSESYTNPDMYLFFQYNIYIAKGFIIKPMTLMVTDQKTFRIDLSTVIDYYGRIFAGISVQMDNKIKIPSLSISTGARINQNFKLYYSYDMDFSSLKTLHDGTHEIVLNYNLNKIIGNMRVLPIIYSPRNL